MSWWTAFEFIRDVFYAIVGGWLVSVIKLDRWFSVLGDLASEMTDPGAFAGGLLVLGVIALLIFRGAFGAFRALNVVTRWETIK